MLFSGGRSIFQNYKIFSHGAGINIIDRGQNHTEFRRKAIVSFQMSRHPGAPLTSCSQCPNTPCVRDRALVLRWVKNKFEFSEFLEAFAKSGFRDQNRREPSRPEPSSRRPIWRSEIPNLIRIYNLRPGLLVNHPRMKRGALGGEIRGCECPH